VITSENSSFHWKVHRSGFFATSAGSVTVMDAHYPAPIDSALS
jgi:hypothetical protein